MQADTHTLFEYLLGKRLEAKLKEWDVLYGYHVGHPIEYRVS